MPVFYKQCYFDKYCFDTSFLFTPLFQVDIMYFLFMLSWFLKCNVVCNFYTSPSTLNLPNIHRNV